MPSVSPHNEADVSAPDRGSWPAHFGNVVDEFAALRSTCGVYLPGRRAKIRLDGSDRVRWLNGMITNNVRDLAAGQGVYAFLLNPQGHILGDLTAYNRGEYLLVDTDRAQVEKILATFDHYIIMDDVEVANVSTTLTTVSVTGPKAEAVLKTAGFDVPQLNPLQVVELAWQPSPVNIIRAETDLYPSYEIWLAPEHSDSLCEALQAAGASPVGRDALELYRVVLGVPRYGQDIRERDLPQETEQQRALNFNKGCYVGQEIVERIRSRGNVHRKFTGFWIAGPAPVPGSKIQFQAKDVGEITSSAVIPASDGNQTVALGYIRREIGVEGKEVEVAGSSAVVTELPFNGLLNR
ncbi:MAG: folate-binding protein [Terriglobales bacterium]